MLDTGPRMRIEPAPLGAPPPIGGAPEKRQRRLGYGRHTYPSLREVLQLKLQQRRTREELVSQGIMPPLKSPAAFHEQRRSLERARTEDYLKRKIRSRPERSELVRMHILEETSAEPSLQAKQLRLKRARLADDLNEKISQRPGPMELIQKNILPVHGSLKQVIIETEFPKVAGESSSFDEDSSDALSPDQPGSRGSPASTVPQPSPLMDTQAQSSTPSPTQSLSLAPPTPEPPAPQQKLTNGAAAPAQSRPTPSLIKQPQGKLGPERPSQRSKKAKDSKPKVKKLKYHQYVPPDQKPEREPPAPLDSSYAKILHQQQLFLQLQIISQQQQHYNYQAILPAPPKPPADQQTSSTVGPSPSRNTPASNPGSSNQGGLSRQGQPPGGGAKHLALPPNLEDLKVAELKQELKLRGLPVSGTKNDLLERLRSYQDQHGGAVPGGAPAGGALKNCHLPQQQQQQLSQAAPNPAPLLGGAAVLHKPGEGGVVVAAFPLVTAAPGPGGGGAAPAVMHFGSTGSTPPVSPTPSDRSLAGMSPDETSCNGDAFGETVSSPLTQLSLHPSPPQALFQVKEENVSGAAPCRFSQPAPGPLDKDQMLQEKDKQIEELTRMLRQKQRLVETLRSQLEQGKRAGDVADTPLRVRVKEEPLELGVSACSGSPWGSFGPPRPPPSPGLPEDAIQVTIKEEPEEEEEMLLPAETLWPRETQERPLQRTPRARQLQHTQQQLQQLQELQHSQQLQQAPAQEMEQSEQLQQAPAQEMEQSEQLQQTPEQQQQQQQQLQQLQEMQLQQSQAQQVSPVFLGQQAPPLQQPLPAPSFPLDFLKAHPPPTLLTDSRGNHFLIALTNHCAEGQPNHSPQGRTPSRITLQRLQSSPTKLPSQSPPQLTASDTQSKQQLQPGLINQPIRKGQRVGLQVLTGGHAQGAVLSFSAPPSLQPFFVGEPAPSAGHAPSPPAQSVLEVCQAPEQHTHFGSVSPVPVSESAKPPLSPLQPSKENGASSQHMDDLFDILIQTGEIPADFKEDADPSPSRLRPNTPPTALAQPHPPSSSSSSSSSAEQLHTPAGPSSSDATPPGLLLLSPPSPPTSPGCSSSSSSSQHALGGDPPPGTGGAPETGVRRAESSAGSGRLEDFLESTTGKPLLGAELDGPLTLIDDLHSQMLSTSSILDHPPSPMDTCELGFATPPQPPSLDFSDPALDSMDWLDLTMGGGGGISGLGGHLSSHTPPSVFSTDFLDSPDLHLHWDSCL
ncbi:myocardin-related transcription factor A isoform X2 [Lepisosteus oculatus]|uniref:myocardin-related transcription factor A isoform X2 n=1 Tax=Lepisosteus oculatus TaxID=7918 RepID=UPI0035F5121B